MIAPENLTVLANMPDVSSKPWKAPSNASAESALSDSYELGSTLGVGYTGSAVKVSELAGKTEGQTKTEGKTEGKTEAGSSSSNLKITKFEPTPLMSTYLVAFACGEFASLSSEHKSVKTGKTIPLRIFATPDAIGQAQFGLDIKKWALPVYEEIFDIPYALPKLDTLVAHDFDAGAMENWGLITGRTTAYLYDPKKSSLSAKKRVAVVQCHELAHMWFGDIVTMKWWDNLWLNEAFATLMGELVILDRIWPEWKPRSEFLNTHLTSALALDSQRSSHPIEVDCPNEDQISQIFDAISYSKGASVLRMLMGVVGEDKFLKGVSIYLKKHLYGNAQTKDLWEGISEASGIDVAKVMANWTLKTGFPVITVDESEAGKIKVTQNRFLATGDVKPEEDETIWWVPLEIKTFKGDTPEVDHKAILSDRSSTYELNGADSFKLNAETVGVYRVNYSPERLQKLGEAASSFSVEDRVGLVSDATTLARAGYGKTSGSLNLVKALGQVETENLPWAQIANALGKLEAVWWEQPEPVRGAIDKLRVELFKPVVERMGYEHAEEDSPDTKELRALAVSSAASAKDQGVLDELNSRFQPFLESNDDSQIPPDLQRTIFVNAVRYGGEKAYEKILAVYNKPANPSTKVDAMYALCSPKDEALIERTFKMLEDGSVKDQDYYIFFFGLGANHAARRKISDYFLDHYDALYKRFENSGINYLVRGSLTSFTSHEDLQRFKDFFKDKDIRRCKLAVHQAYDSIQASADWLKRDQKDVEEVSTDELLVFTQFLVLIDRT
jgi:aminopeptidase 2